MLDISSVRFVLRALSLVLVLTSTYFLASLSIAVHDLFLFLDWLQRVG